MPLHADLTASFILLIQEHERIIHKVCRAYGGLNEEDRKDLFQDIVLQAWKAYPKFSRQAKESTWLYRIALNTAISGQRKSAGRPKVYHHEDLLAAVPDVASSEQDNSTILYRAIGHLPVLDRALLLLYLDDKSAAEIAEIMGITASNVGTRIGRIKEKLRQLAQPLIAS